MNRSLAAAMLAALAACSAQAQFGAPRTRTSDGNADMKLGDYKGLKNAIGCKNFTNEAGWRGNWEIGENLTIMLESALADTGRFVVVERQMLKDIIAEQDLAASGRAARAGKVAQTGMIRPARYLATGAVTEVAESQSGGSGGIGIGGFRIGGGRSEAQIAVIVKLIDTTTGEVVAKERVVGKAGRTNLNVGIRISGVSTDLGGFTKTPLGQAAQDCINQAAAMIAKKMEEFPFDGSVVKVGEDGRIIINRGEQFGVQPGMELVLVQPGELLLDPDTGEVLEREAGKTLGRIKVSRVSEKVSYCDPIEGEKNPKPGTSVQAPR